MRAAAEAPIGFDLPWQVTAMAICAKPGGAVRDVELVTASTGPSGGRFQVTAAGCPSGKRATGSGAAVRTSGGAMGDGNRQLGLQLNRTSGPMDISRSAAAANTATPAPWRLVSYASCAQPIEGAAVHGFLWPSGGEFSCPVGQRALSVGGGGPLQYPGQAFLDLLEATADLHDFAVEMVGVPNLQIAVGAVCAPI